MKPFVRTMRASAIGFLAIVPIHMLLVHLGAEGGVADLGLFFTALFVASLTDRELFYGTATATRSRRRPR
jgi:hypothetical protein